MDQTPISPQLAETPPPPEEPNGPRRLNRKLFIITLAVILLLAGGIPILLMTTKDTPKKSNTSEQKQQTAAQDDFAQQYLRGCNANRQVSFTQSPVLLAQLGSIEPMGKTSDGHVTPTDHVYVAPKNQTAADNTTDVVMPADGTVTSIQTMPAQYIGDRNQQVAAEDHRLVIAHNCRYVSIFIHVHQLSDALKKAAGDMQPNSQKEVSVELKAGDKLGKIGGNPVDWSLMDATKKLSGFITPALYKGEPWKVHVIDPLSAYSDELKAQLIAKSLRTVPPYGGKIDYDKPGALAGNWFREGTNGYAGVNRERYWDGHFSIAPNHIDPTAVTISLGNWQGKATQFTAVSGPAKPEDITRASGIVKYEVIAPNYVAPDGAPFDGQVARGSRLLQTGPVQGVVLLQVMDGEKLKVELFPGKPTASVGNFTSAAQLYTR